MFGNFDSLLKTLMHYQKTIQKLLHQLHRSYDTMFQITYSDRFQKPLQETIKAET